MPYGDGTGPVWGRGIGCGIPRGCRSRPFGRRIGGGLGFARFWSDPNAGDPANTAETDRQILEREQQLLKSRLAQIQERLGKE